MTFAENLVTVFAQIDLLQGCCCATCQYSYLAQWRDDEPRRRINEFACGRGYRNGGGNDYCFDWKDKTDTGEEAA